jgi:hypothetical protein
MINGQRQTWSNGRAFDPATYWILTQPTSEYIYQLDIYDNDTLLAVSFDSLSNSTQVQLLNLNGITQTHSKLSSGIYHRAGAFDSGGNVYIAGTLTGGSGNTWIGKLNSTLTSIIWQKELRDIEGCGVDDDAMLYMPDGNIVLGGIHGSSSGGFVTKINSEGSVQWTTTQNGPIQQLAVDSTNNIYATATINGNTKLTKYDSVGTTLWTSEYWKFAPGESDTNRVFTTEIIVDSNDSPWLSFYGQYRATLMPVWSANGAPKNQYSYYRPDVSTTASFRFQDMTPLPTGNIIASGGLVNSGIIMEIDSSGTIAWVGNIDSISANTISLNQVVLSANADIYTQTIMDTGETIFALGNNFSTTGTYNNNGETYLIYPYSLSQEGGNINSKTSSVTPDTFAGSSYVTGSATITTPIYPSLRYTPIKTNPPPAPPAGIDIEYLAVAGGGGGGGAVGGGGGAGGMLTSTYTAVAASTVITVTVGAGGAGGGISGGFASPGTSGGNTTISGTGLTTITAVGGGGGGASAATPVGGAAGGSGGGGCYDTTNNANLGGAGTAGQGNDGGDGSPITFPYPTGGGGGAGAVGADYSGSNSGDGGVGIQSSITGTATYYAGGGGGGGSAQGAVPGAGGSGGGSAGSTGNASDATANTGGGGGGGGNSGVFDAGDGGSGVGILRLLTSQYTGTVTGSPTVTTDGSYTVIKFTSTGTYTA